MSLSSRRREGVGHSRNKLNDENQKLLTQEKKRKQFLLRQKSLRQDQLAKARRLIGGDIGDENIEEDIEVQRIEGDVMHVEEGQDDIDMEVQATHNICDSKRPKGWKEKNRNCNNFAREYLQEPEWMVEIPDDLCRPIANHGDDEGEYSCWYVMPRPEGQRCLVKSAGGRTTSYLESGRILHSFRSALPGGGGGGGGRHGSASVILDCIYHSENNVYFVMDIINWNELSCFDCDVNFRLFWLQSKFEELGDVLMQCSGQNQRPFCLVPYFHSSPSGIEQAYELDTFSNFGYRKNGLIFLHKEGHYEMGGLTPLVLLWKDSSTCRYIDNGSGISGSNFHMSIALRVTECDNNSVERRGDEFWLSTREGAPLLKLSSHQFSNLMRDISSDSSPQELNSGDVVRVSVEVTYLGSALRNLYDIINGQVKDNPGESTNKFIVENVSPVSSPSGSKPVDAWSKIMFKYMLRAQDEVSPALTILDIVSKATSLSMTDTVLCLPQFSSS